MRLTSQRSSSQDACRHLARVVSSANESSDKPAGDVKELRANRTPQNHVTTEGYGSNQLELRIVVTLPAAEPMAARVLHVGEHS